MPHKDNDYVPKLWDYDNTKQAVVLTQKELKALRDELNEEYLRRWSGYTNGVHRNRLYMDYTRASTQFTDEDGKHIHRLPDWNTPVPTPTKSTSNQSQYRMADGNVDNSYWSSYTVKDFRGSPAYYGPLDRYIDGSIQYNINSNRAPTVISDYNGPDPGKTFPVGTSEWRNAEQYHPHGVTDITKHRSFKHLIDGLANIVDIDKYFGTGIQSGDPVNPYNPVDYGRGQDPNNSERINHAWRQMGLVTNTSTPGHPATTDKPGTIKDWIDILRSEQRNEYYVRACNYQHWIWYFVDFKYSTKWQYVCNSKIQVSPMPSANSFREPKKTSDAKIDYIESNFQTGKHRKNYNPSYYGHRESYTSCLGACTGFCSQSCFHVCDEQCVYLCDDKCGYSCMDGTRTGCGSVCISNCRDLCGGDIMQEGNSGGNPCQFSCMSGANMPARGYCSNCATSCQGFIRDEQACSDCTGYCSQSCDNICINSCKFNCSDTTCMISCHTECVESRHPQGEPSKQNCASGECKGGCDDTCEAECEDEADGETRSRRMLKMQETKCEVVIDEKKTDASDTVGL